LVNTAWAFATLEVLDDPLTYAIAAQALESSGEFDARELANLAWACATLHCAHLKLMDAIASAAIRKSRFFGAQHLSNTVWAFASLAILDSPLLDSISEAASKTISQFRAQDLSNLAWALATLNIEDAPLLTAISAASRLSLPDFQAQNMSNISWAYATIGVKDEPLLHAIASKSMPRMNDFEKVPQNMSNLVWSVSSMQIADAPLMAAISSASLRQMTSFDQQGLTNTAWSFAKLAFVDGPLLAAISAASISLMHYFDGQNLANLAWSLATFVLVNKPLCDAIASEALRKISQVATQSLADLVWSCAMLTVYTSVDVSCLSQRLFYHVALLVDALPRSLDEDDRFRYQSKVGELQIVNLRSGTRYVLEALGIRRAPVDFKQRAVLRIRSLSDAPGGERPVGLGGAGLDTTRVFAYAEYVFGSPLVDGHLFSECGFRGCQRTVAKRSADGPRRPSSILRAFRLPNSAKVDRKLCAEFQVLSELCSLFSGAEEKTPPGESHLVGVLSLFTTTSPCCSCLGALAQFRLLFPEVAFEHGQCEEPLALGEEHAEQTSLISV